MDNDDLDKLVSRVKYDLHKRKSTTPIKSQRPKKIRLGTDNRYVFSSSVTQRLFLTYSLQFTSWLLPRQPYTIGLLDWPRFKVTIWFDQL